MTRSCYDTLADVLASIPNTIEIEIVPSAALLPDLDPNPHTPFVLIEGHLGVPKKALYQAYLDASRAFGTSDSDILHTSAVILLANPAHSTALNARKKLIAMGQRDIRLELVFTASLLSEQQASKSSFLWHHRRWLLHFLYAADGAPFSDDLETCCGIPQDVLLHEIELAERACEVYPRNYFAWKHRRHCAQRLSDLSQELDAVHVWLNRHVSDYSAAHHACAIPRPDTSPDLLAKNFDHALSLVTAYPAHESLWIYLRIALLRCEIFEPDVRERIDEQMWSLLRRFGVDDSPKEAIDGPSATRNARCVARKSNELPEHVFAARCAQWLNLARGGSSATRPPCSQTTH